MARQRHCRRLARNGKPAASLLTPSSSEPRTPAGKARVLDARKWLRERDGLSAGGKWIRTSSTRAQSRNAVYAGIPPPAQSRTDPSTPPVGSDSVTSAAAEFDPVLRTPLPQSRLLGRVRKIVPPFEGAPLHDQLLISAVSTSSTEDVANFIVVVG